MNGYNEYIDNNEWDEEDCSDCEEYDEYDEYEEVEVDLSRFPAYPVKPDGVEFGIFITDILISTGLARDDRDAEKAIGSGEISVNGEVVPKAESILTEEDFWEGYVCIEKGGYDGRFVVLDL